MMQPGKDRWLGQLLTGARCELTRWRRSPALLAVAGLPPLAMGLLLAVLALNVSHEPVALVVEDAGVAADRMTEILVADTDAYLLTVTDRARAQELLASQRVAAVITIPSGFTQAVAHRVGRLELSLNNIDIDFADDIRRSLDRSVGAFDGLPIEVDRDDLPGSLEAPEAPPTSPSPPPQPASLATPGSAAGPSRGNRLPDRHPGA